MSSAMSHSSSGVDRNVAAIERNFAALSREADVDRYLAGCAEGFVLEFPFGTATRLEGRDAVRTALLHAFRRVSLELTFCSVYHCQDPDRIIAEYQSAGPVLATGAPYANSYIGVFEFECSLLRFHREYADPTRAV
ncbi:nuclear transport factor 2 family protein [Nocardia jiangxiensis]|uniref:Nuclear transport factor 2 family protein n=1 Tax=Nocardia jiangxiensis TaxID=282685 RepID=A0ABW6S188_9NOCA